MSVKRHTSLMTASDIEQVAGVSRTKATEIIKSLGGVKDVAGRWMVDAQSFHVWYNSPCRSVSAQGGVYQMKIDELVAGVYAFSAGEPVNFSLCRRMNSPMWKVRVYKSDRREKLISTGTDNKKAAQEIHAAIMTHFRQAEMDGIMPTLSAQFFDDWLAGKESALAVKSWARYRAVIDKAKPFMAEHVHKTTGAHIERYRDWLVREHYHDATIGYELKVLKEVFAKAERLRHTRENPVRYVVRPRKPESTVTYYTPIELETIFAECNRRTREGLREQSKEAWTVYTDLFYCLDATGLRVGDALSLKWRNVNFHFSAINLRQTKTGREVTIRIPSTFKERLRQIIEEKPGAEYVFTNTAGKQILYSHVDAAIRSVLKSCGIVKKSPLHSFRHGVAVRLLSAGVPLHQVAGQLGDTVETVTKHYLKPETVGLALIDHAYENSGQVSRKCPVNTVKKGCFKDKTATLQTAAN